MSNRVSYSSVWVRVIVDIQLITGFRQYAACLAGELKISKLNLTRAWGHCGKPNEDFA